MPLRKSKPSSGGSIILFFEQCVGAAQPVRSCMLGSGAKARPKLTPKARGKREREVLAAESVCTSTWCQRTLGVHTQSAMLGD